MTNPPAVDSSIVRDKRAMLFFLLGALMLGNAIVAELIGVKLFQLEEVFGLPKADFRLLGKDGLSFVLSAGVISWPLVFLVTDLANDYFGVRGVRRITVVTALLIALIFPLLYVAIALPAERGWWLTSSAGAGVPDMQQAFTAVFGQGMNIIVGSLVAFLVSQLVDAFVFRRFKRFTGEKRIWLRATGSTLVSQFIDSLLVVYIAFGLFRGMPVPEATALALTSYCYKFLVAVVSTPLVYLGHWLVEWWLGPELAARMRREAMQTQQ
ncbi:MAG: queuosine precursor transporter [Planctomycetes bacterium]|nr:queuosine precursor transporter [Planctomycetota bacterium]